MPDGLIPDEGLDNSLLRILDPAGRGGSATWRLIFFVNDITPDADTVLADLDEATWGGYSFVTLMPGLWVTPIVSDGCATSNYGTDALQWNVLNSMSQTNYGYALVDPGAGVIRFIQRFDDADIQPLVTGGTVLLLPQYTLTSAACPGAPPP
jgi:hypothetical protein